MLRPNLISRIRLKKVSSFLALVLVMFLIGSILFGGFLGPRPQSLKAFDLEINGTNRYILDGWEMSNTNALGRVAPAVNRNGRSVRVSNNVVQRMDNSANGYNNNPLFASIDASNPLIYSYQNTDGKTHLSDLDIAGYSMVTHTPLDYLTLSERDHFLTSGLYAFGLKMTGYYYNAANIPNLEITAAADDGSMIEAYYSGAWHTVSDDYSDHSIRFPGAAPTPINYTAGTFLPIRITYYNIALAGDSAGLTIFVKDETGDWFIPTYGSGSTAGRFYSLPVASDGVEGLIVDFYQDNRKPKYYDGATLNKFSSRDGVVFSSATAFDLDNYRFSYRDVYYINTFSSDGTCALEYNVAYAALPNSATLRACDGRGGPFVLEDGFPPARYPAIGELYLLDGYRNVYEWYGGRSRLKLEVENKITMNPGFIDVTGNGWIGGPMVVDRIFGSRNAKGFGGAVSGTTHWNGGGWQNYNTTANNGVSGGGSFGGFGDAAEPYDEFFKWFSLGVSDVYGASNDVEYLGSGGGSTRANDIRKYGGSGGGLISIIAPSIEMSADSQIKSDGIAGYGEGGAGSGGGIHIVGDIRSADGSPVVTANGGPNDGTIHSGYGGGGRIYIEGAVDSASKITAWAGCEVSVYSCATRKNNLKDYPPLWATDGTVLIKKAPITVKKYLTPHNRGSVLNFNPYALQTNDKINVNLELRNLGYTACPSSPLPEKLLELRIIYDEYLHTNDGEKKCKYLSDVKKSDKNGNASGINLEDQGDKLRIGLSCVAEEPIIIVYQCEVK